MSKIWFGLHLPNYTFPDRDPARLFDQAVVQAQAAEEAGFDLVTVMDHLNQIPGIGQQDEPMLEAWTALAGLARETKRVQLGTLVTGVTYRNPALLAKTATTLDVISGGRAIFGIGAAWFEAEHDAFGYPFPPIGERMDRLDEALAIAKGMFEHERSSFDGRFYHATDILNVPRPVRPGGLPILVGGGGEQRTLKIAAKYADMTHWFPMGREALAHKTDVLRQHCEAIGRDPSTIERTMQAPVVVTRDEAEKTRLLDRIPPDRRPHVIAGTPEQCVEGLKPYLDDGFTGFTFNNTMYDTPDRIALVGDLLHLLAAVPAG
jgi:F420-dependent oxidoreductase-like protein